MLSIKYRSFASDLLPEDIRTFSPQSSVLLASFSPGGATLPLTRKDLSEFTWQCHLGYTSVIFCSSVQAVQSVTWATEMEEAVPAVQCAPFLDNTSCPLHSETSSARSEGADL
ncbi:unnamed protein product [Pleuronectes platessa]|uniref:Uncharacterized protein n=1 Tax=Pleuronectes platessa TaxID=8262 RepID=A0A9N7VA43_PLEPL|nr:unnamed protein product [Pleuronectes platessa]